MDLRTPHERRSDQLSVLLRRPAGASGAATRFSKTVDCALVSPSSFRFEDFDSDAETDGPPSASRSMRLAARISETASVSPNASALPATPVANVTASAITKENTAARRERRCSVTSEEAASPEIADVVFERDRANSFYGVVEDEDGALVDADDEDDVIDGALISDERLRKHLEDDYEIFANAKDLRYKTPTKSPSPKEKTKEEDKPKEKPRSPVKEKRSKPKEKKEISPVKSAKEPTDNAPVSESKPGIIASMLGKAKPPKQPTVLDMKKRVTSRSSTSNSAPRSASSATVFSSSTVSKQLTEESPSRSGSENGGDSSPHIPKSDSKRKLLDAESNSSPELRAPSTIVRRLRAQRAGTAIKISLRSSSKGVDVSKKGRLRSVSFESGYSTCTELKTDLKSLLPEDRYRSRLKSTAGVVPLFVEEAGRNPRAAIVNGDIQKVKVRRCSGEVTRGGMFRMMRRQQSTTCSDGQSMFFVTKRDGSEEDRSTHSERRRRRRKRKARKAKEAKAFARDERRRSKRLFESSRRKWRLGRRDHDR